MAAKKRRIAKKKVTISIDAGTLRKLIDAIAALSTLAVAYEEAADDPKLRRDLLKRGKRRR